MRVGVHALAAEAGAAVEEVRCCSLAPGPKRHEKRQEMLFRRVGVGTMGSANAIIHEVGRPAFHDGVMNPVAEIARPFRLGCIQLPAGQRTQIMNESAGTQHQHILLPQRSQRRTELHMVFGAELRLKRELDRGNIGLRIHQHEGHPGAMIEPTPVIDGGCKTCLDQGVPRLFGHLGRSGRRISHAIQRFGKSTEVVNRLVDGDGIDRGHIRVPMGGDGDDGARARERCTQTLQKIARRAIVEGKRRRTVRDENRGEHGLHMARRKFAFKLKRRAMPG